jgi:acyl-CoA thioester hydrolase
MRHDVWRREPDAYPLRGEVLPRYTDVDVWQHLNNVALITLHAEAVQTALRSVLGEQAWRERAPALAVSAGATDFLAEGQYPGPVRWGARLLAADAGGLRVATALFQKDQCIGLHESRLSGWSEGRDIGLPATALAALRAAGVPQAPAMASTASAPVSAPMAGAGAFPWQTTFPLRFADSDAHRLVSDTCLARAAEQLRVAFLDEVFDGRREMLGGMLVAHVSVQWLQRTVAPGQWQLGCGVARVGDRSLAVRGAMYDADRCVATCEAVMVALNRGGPAGGALSDAARARLAGFSLSV